MALLLVVVRLLRVSSVEIDHVNEPAGTRDVDTHAGIMVWLHGAFLFLVHSRLNSLTIYVALPRPFSLLFALDTTS